MISQNWLQNVGSVDKAHSGVDVNFAPQLRLNRAAPLTKLGIGKNYWVNEKKHSGLR
jgi:hypothetical protein